MKIYHRNKLNPKLKYKEKTVTVDFYCAISKENSGIGSYEYWGSKGYDSWQDYLVVDDITWDESLHTKQENDIIKQFIDDTEEYEKLETEITEWAEK